MQERPVLLATVGAGSTAGTMLLLRKMEKRNATATRILTWTLIGIRGYALARNMTKLR